MRKVCLVCGSSSLHAIYQNSLLKCSQCSFVSANTEISTEQLQELYSEKYFNGEEYVNYLMDKNIIQYNFKKKLNSISKIFPKENFTNVLEIGCAYGFFGEMICNKFKNLNYSGIDISKDAVDYGIKKYSLNLQAIDYLKLPPSEYSDIFMWDVIEHLDRPDLYFEKINRELMSGGRIYISTGDIGAFIPRWKKEKWRMIHPPTHLHFFSSQTIKLFLHKYNFKVKIFTYPIIYRSLKQIFYSLFILRKKNTKWAFRIYNLITDSIPIPLNTYDIMFVIGEKQ